MIGFKEIKAFELETDPTRFWLLLTGFYRIKKTCCEELLDSERSAHERCGLSGTHVSVSVITEERLVITRTMNAPIDPPSN